MFKWLSRSPFGAKPDYGEQFFRNAVDRSASGIDDYDTQATLWQACVLDAQSATPSVVSECQTLVYMRGMLLPPCDYQRTFAALSDREKLQASCAIVRAHIRGLISNDSVMYETALPIVNKAECMVKAMEDARVASLAHDRI